MDQLQPDDASWPVGVAPQSTTIGVDRLGDGRLDRSLPQFRQAGVNCGEVVDSRNSSCYFGPVIAGAGLAFDTGTFVVAGLLGGAAMDAPIVGASKTVDANPRHLDVPSSAIPIGAIGKDWGKISPSVGLDRLYRKTVERTIIRIRSGERLVHRQRHAVTFAQTTNNKPRGLRNKDRLAGQSFACISVRLTRSR